MKAQKQKDGVYYGFSNGEFYPIQDPQAAYFYNLWQQFQPDEVVRTVLANTAFWEADLSKLSNFVKQVSTFLMQMLEASPREVLEIFPMQRNTIIP